MGVRYCPYCKQIVETKTLMKGYKHQMYNGIPVKLRLIVHKEEDGGCGQTWETVEIPVEYVIGYKKGKP
ncbi:MAG: hypothetical protein C4576_13790 [Desulfobacteraceae bacterium]|nr:MAG: hypothetical protein C4576_13790 [Desulfobacteraceae bacterium]